MIMGKYGYALLGSLALSTLSACGGDDDAGGSGSVTVILESESTITAGLDPGDAIENIRDGWSVRYDNYILAVGDIDIHFASDENNQAEDARVFVADLKLAPESGLPLWSIAGLRSGRWE